MGMALKPVCVSVGNLVEFYLYATEKEITVVKSRQEQSFKEPVTLNDTQKFPRVCRVHQVDIGPVVLETHPGLYNEADKAVRELLVYVPKTNVKKHPYFKVRTYFRYKLTINMLRYRTMIPMLSLRTDHHMLPQAIRVFGPEIIPSVFPAPLLRPVSAVPQNHNTEALNPMLDTTKLDEFVRSSSLLPVLQDWRALFTLCHCCEELLAPLRGTRYMWMDLKVLDDYCDPRDLVATETLRQIQGQYRTAAVTLWRLFCALQQQFPSNIYLIASLFQREAAPCFADLMRTANAQESLAKLIHRSDYATLKRQRSTTVPWPHALKALEQLSANGFVHTPKLLQPDLATCRQCNWSAYAWNRYLEPSLHHQPSCSHYRHT